MQASQRVFVNTIAQYARTIINMVLSLYTVRLVLSALGNDDYGIYTLIAGMVAMLSFITNSLVTTTQRFVSFYQGVGDKEKQKSVFNNSLVIHILLGAAITMVLAAIQPLLFNGFLNITPERVGTAKHVYQLVLLMLLLTFITSPFRALLISHENIVYLSLIDVLDGVLKVVLVLILTNISWDKLLFYSIIMAFVQLFNFFALSVYSYVRYEECVWPDFRQIDKGYLKELFSFAGWSIYSTGCIVGRQQGIAVVLNRIMGTAVNAAYGIAFNIAGYTGFLSTALVNAIVPQIVKSEGSGNRERVLWLSTITCKFMFFLLSAICIPCFFEIDYILDWWLVEVPENASLFCKMVIVTSMIDALTVGLANINQAIGRIGPYSLIVNTPKLLALPCAFICLKLSLPLLSVAVTYVIVELLCACLRLPFIHRTAGLNVERFMKEVIAMEILPALCCIAACELFTRMTSFHYRFVVTFMVAMIIYAPSIFFFGLQPKEKIIIQNIGKQLLSRFK